MTLRISGKNIEIGSAFRSHAEGRIGDAVSKYFDGGFNGHLTLEPDGSGYRVDCTVHLDTGVTLQAEGSGHDVYRTFDVAAERIEKRLRRYKRRLRDHHHGLNGAAAGPDLDAASYVLAAPDDETEIGADYHPVVIAESTTQLRTLSVSGAVIAMDLADAPVLVFRHAGHGGVNVVYRRADGNIGWIDPALVGKGDSVAR
ncbi:ribosome hibernation-promoting factor, HPF/YfiA family [Prosthecomicrobium pneumaticum]|uniref:Ribosome hibernation promoting factor n=1 Tax=Prosthecomicrobium pneumaticum TaxID=81895 RepID=A0A7W9L2Z9_9HYPH|nr:ribosome-associated translation inhibitor RaiA [Prosthecomicrobium pneumaticum]MBB5754055.1 ribosomal subunit interface protein [Prosthecomicrobium pneumaticum]